MTVTHRRRVMALGLFGGLASALLHAQEARLEPVEVTGSFIRRAGTAGLLPLEVHHRRDILRTGATTLNEWLRSVPTVDLRDLGELVGDFPGLSGTASVRLRGLDETGTLVLLNGRRLPINAMHDTSGMGAAVDLNAVPLSMIERVEILKDGASALYGADAMAGVVNIITRRAWQGFEARVAGGAGTRRGGTESRIGLGWGAGDLEGDGFQWLGSLDLLRRTPIYRKDRAISSSADFRRFGGPDARSGFSPYGNVVDADYFYTGATVLPCPEALYNERCRYDFNADLLTAYNGAERVGGFLSGTWALGRGRRLEADLLASTARNRFDSHPVPEIFSTAAGEVYFGRFMQGGARQTTRRADMQAASLTLSGSDDGLDWSVDAGQGRNRVVNRDRNYFERERWDAALAAGELDPTVQGNDPMLVEGLKVRPARTGTSVLSFANARVSGPLGPQGAALATRFAAGASWWREHLVDRPDALTQAGTVVGGVQQAAVEAGRTASAVYAELAVPWTQALETQFALRHDRYPTAQRTSPKVALRYAWSPEFSLRASYAGSFRMPTLKQLLGAREEGAADFTSDTLCAAFGQPSGCTLTGLEVYGANPALKPEKGRTWTLGLALEPGPGVRVGLDWWHLHVRDAIDTPTIDQAVAAGRYGRDADGRLYVGTHLANFTRIRNEGVDVDVRWQGPRWSGVRFTLRHLSTHYLRQQKQREAASVWEEFNATYNRPRWRHVLSAGAEGATWDALLSVRTVSGFYDTDEPDPQRDRTRFVPAHTELDLSARVDAGSGVRLELGVKNLTNRIPPFSAQNAVSNQYSQLGFAELYAARGRFIHAGLTLILD